MPDRPKDVDALVREALRLALPRERREYLDRVCGSDAELRAAAEEALARAEAATADQAPTSTGGIAPSAPLPPQEQETAVASGAAGAGAATPAGADTLGEKPGSIIGPYRLIQVLGEGGFGTVFLAEQDKPIRREVALKIIKLGMDTREVIARFDAERQALAIMDHPSIARVFDAGATSSGRPYFVMELVRGVPITTYCDEHDLKLQDRLQLFNQVCAAVQHAHQKGIIHRDIKPSNVLVAEHEGVPLPKVIDFGIAKATAQGLGEHTAFTAMGQVIGTPAYMSPEQAGLDNLDIDTRSDVYSLGVLLYEMLTGTVPFGVTTVQGILWTELQRMIREQEPPKPSTRVGTMKGKRTTVAGRRLEETGRIGAALRGDLDWIVMKALEKDRGRRYESAREFANDIERHLRHEPVTAGPPSASYRASKFVRRHKAGVGVAAAAVLVLVAFAATMTVQARRIATERDRANREREISDRVADFQASMLQRIRPFDMGKSIVADLRESIGARLGATAGAPAGSAPGSGAQGPGAPAAGKPAAVPAAASAPAPAAAQAALASFDGLLGGINPTDTARRVLDAQILRPATDAVTEQFDKQPETEARMRLALARTYRSLGMPDKSLAQAERAVAVSEKTFGPENRQTLLSRVNQAIALWDLGRLDECEKILAAVVPEFTRLFGPEDLDGLRAKVALGVLYMGRERSPDAQKLFEEALAAQERVLGKDHKDLVNTLNNLATALLNQNQYTQAAPYLERAVGIQKKQSGTDDMQVLSMQQRLSQVYQRLGRPKEAEALQREAVEIIQRTQGEQHPQAIAAIANLALLYRLQSRFAEAEALARKALEMRRATLGESHPETLKSMQELAITLSAMDRHEEAEPLFRDLLERTRKTLGPEAPLTLDRMNNLAVDYWFEGRFAQAAELFEQVLEITKRTQGEESEGTVFAMTNLSVMKAKLGLLDEAQALSEKAVAVRTKTFGPEHKLTLESLAGLGDIAYRRKHYAEAEKIFVRLLEGRKKALGPDDPVMFETWFNLAQTYDNLGQKDKAMSQMAGVLERRRAILGNAHAQTLDSIQELARLYAENGRMNDARPLVVEAMTARRAGAASKDASPADLVACAKLLLTSPVEDLRSPKEALDLALRASERTNDKDPGILRTLARAWHDTGNSARAVETQRRALGFVSPTDPDRADYQKELDEYRGKPKE